jgi:hypothetical protein
LIDTGLAAAIRTEYDIVSEIVDIGIARKIPIYLPFEGAAIGPFRVLNPTRYAYNYLLPQFDKTPNPDQSAIQAARNRATAAAPKRSALRAARHGAQPSSWENRSSEISLSHTNVLSLENVFR